MIYAANPVNQFFNILFLLPSRTQRIGTTNANQRVVHLNGPPSNESGSTLPGRSAPRRAAISFRWAVRDSAIQMLPPTSKRPFKWSYILTRTLRRLHPGTYF
jgi:hypothetical protein